MKILAVDYGERRTGVAVSDDIGITAQGHDTIEVKDEGEIPARIASLAAETRAERIVVGLPLNMNGTESEKSAKVRVVGDEIARMTSLPVVFWDERMTSQQAHRIMRETGVKTKGNKGQIDRITATLILQEYLRTVV